MKTLMNFFRIIDGHTVTVTFLAVASTFLCDRFGLAADIPTGLIGIAIIFPIVFSINAAYRRREEALKSFASLKSHAVAVFFAHRDWVPEGGPEKHAPREETGLSLPPLQFQDDEQDDRPGAGSLHARLRLYAPRLQA